VQLSDDLKSVIDATVGAPDPAKQGLGAPRPPMPSQHPATSTAPVVQLPVPRAPLPSVPVAPSPPMAPEPPPPPVFAAPAMTMWQRVAAATAEPPGLARGMALRASPAPPAPPPSPAPPAVDLRDAAARGAAAASNAAAATASEPATPTGNDRDARPAAPAREPAREHVDLLWFDADSVARVTSDKAFSDGRPRPAVTWLAGDSAPRESAEVKGRREILAIFGRVTALDEAGLTAIANAAYQPDGTFAAPLAFVAGELSFSFDEMETLRATITVVSPFTGNDKKLKDAVQNGTDALKSEWGLTLDVAEGLTRRIEESFAQGQRSVAPNYLENSVEKILLEGRRYQKKNLFGASRVRALFTCASGGAAIPAYLPEAALPKLPLFRRFRAKAIVEVRPQEDQYETHADALLVLALGRVLRRS
jgi:hypothetical protein